MSGGVDSSVAAQLLKEQGHELVGVFLHFWKDQDVLEENKCCSTSALMDARRICQLLKIKLYTMNFSNEFKQEIVDYFLDAYQSGFTPNPCVKCNKFVKLGLLIKRAQELDFSKVASGHYAILKKSEGKYRLYRAKDKDKDQSYFLWSLTQEQLSHLEFPLGEYTKTEVRKIAKKKGLHVASKKESQEICFIPGKSYNEFLKKHLKLKKGPIINLTPAPHLKTPPPAPPLNRGGGLSMVRQEEVIGQHQGLPLYTLGQRKGIEIGGTGPYYAVKMDYKTNTLYVVKDRDDKALYSDSLIAKDVNWISGVEPKLPLKCEAVIRYRSKPVKCNLTPCLCRQAAPLLLKERDDRAGLPPLTKGEIKRGLGGEVKVEFEKPQRAVTKGQSVVFYSSTAASAKVDKKDEVLGGGVII